MGHELFDEHHIIDPRGLSKLHLTGGYGREEVWLGIGKIDDDIPLINIELGPDEQRELIAAIRKMVRRK